MQTYCGTCRHFKNGYCKLFEVRVPNPNGGHCERWQAEEGKTMTGLESMTAQEGREIIREIMTAYNKARAAWFTRFKHYDDFDEWFRRQTTTPR